MPTADLLQPAQLNTFNVHQLQFGGKNDQLDFYDQAIIPVDTSLDHLHYDARRMSSSATSTADTDSSMLSRPEKRSLTPGDSPLPKRQQRDSAEQQWDQVENAQSPHHHQQQQQQDDRGSDAGIDKVSLPSIFTSFDGDQYRHDSRRASLPTLSENRVRHAPYPPTHIRQQQQQNYAPSNLSSYSFPNSGDDAADRNISSRPRVSTDLNFDYSQSTGYPASGLSTGTTPSTSFSSSQFNSPLNPDIRTPGLSPYSESDNWNGASPAHIVRPSSTPGGLSSPAVKYDDGLRHSSFSAASLPQAQMFAGSARISGQHDRRSLSGGIKSEWGFPNPPDFVLPPQHHHHGYSPGNAPNISVSTPSSARSPHHHMPPQSTLVDRPPTRKRGKLPKETTDYLKAWLHRHSDHPYPSEEEKKQLCHATSLSMSQVSNWMINARRRILAPAHRAASGPTTTAPFPPSGRSSLNGMMDPIGRRASMPSADALQLYHPMSLQSMPNSPAGHHPGHTHPGHGGHHDPHSKYGDYIGGPARHMMGPGTSSRHSDARSDYGHSNGHSSNGGGGSGGGGGRMGLYVSSAGGGHGGSGGGYSDVPLSAPATMSGNPFSSSQQGGAGGNGGGSGHLVPPSPRSSGQTQYFDGPGHSGSGSGSGYGTPQ